MPEQPNHPRAERLLADLIQRLPPLTPEDVAATLAEYAAGQTKDLEDSFAEVAGVDRETWLREVAERQAPG